MAVSHDIIRNRLLAVIATVLVVVGLRASYPVTMPLAAAAVVIAAVWPVKQWLDRALPSSLSYLGAIIVLLAVLAGFCYAVYFAAAEAVEAFIRNEARFDAAYTRVTAQLSRWGLPDPGGREGYVRLIGVASACCRAPIRSRSMSGSLPSWSRWVCPKSRHFTGGSRAN